MSGKGNRLFALGIFAALPVCSVDATRAHSWYAAACCSERDCAPVEDGVVIEKSDGVLAVGPSSRAHLGASWVAIERCFLNSGIIENRFCADHLFW